MANTPRAVGGVIFSSCAADNYPLFEGSRPLWQSKARGRSAYINLSGQTMSVGGAERERDKGCRYLGFAHKDGLVGVPQRVWYIMPKNATSSLIIHISLGDAPAVKDSRTAAPW